MKFINIKERRLDFDFRGVMVKVQYLFGHLEMGVDMVTTVIVMVTQIAFTLCL